MSTWTSPDGLATVLHGDCRARMRELAENSVDSIVCDPPYGLEFMGKEFDTFRGANFDPGFCHWFAGFTDGEGCFSVHKKNVNGYETYDCQFSITLRADDRPILEQIQQQLNIGTLSKPTAHRTGEDNPKARFSVSAKAELIALRDLFRSFPLRAKKAADFVIWSQALDAWLRHEPGDWHEMKDARERLMSGRAFNPSGIRINQYQMWCITWAIEAFRVLKPGGHLLAFGGTRTFHRLACAIEDAGFEIRDTLCWMYGQGFPKGLDVSKAIDKQAGAERTEVIGTRSRNVKPFDDENGWNANSTTGAHEYTAPATEAARQWDGWNVALKPAFEPVVLARKPLSESGVAANVLRWGTGAINIGDCRIGLNGDYKCGANGRPSQTGLGDNYDPDKANQHSPVGRWPANVLLQHHPECRCVGTKHLQQVQDSPDDGDNIPVVQYVSDSSIQSGDYLIDFAVPVFESASLVFDGIEFDEQVQLRKIKVNREALTIGLDRKLMGDGNSHVNQNIEEYELIHRDGQRFFVCVAVPPVSGAPLLVRLSSNCLAFARAENAVGSTANSALVRSERLSADKAGTLHLRCRISSTQNIRALLRTRGSSAEFEYSIRNTVGLIADGAGLVVSRHCNAPDSDGTRIKQNTTTIQPQKQDGIEAWECHRECPVRLLDEQSGTRKSGRLVGKYDGGGGLSAYGKSGVADKAFEANEGGASRFFYQSKASKLGRWFYCRDCQSAHCETDRAAHQHGHTQPGRPDKPDWSHIVAHPTVKPVQLMAYITRLVTPPGGLILDPFGGTGTTAVAALQEHFRVIVCEQDPEYLEIIRARIAAEQHEPVAPRPRGTKRPKAERPLPLFDSQPIGP